MTIEDFLQLATYGIQTAILVAAPPLIFGLIGGVTVSIFQAATQINDSALAFIPKILGALIALLIFGPWMVTEISDFASYSIGLMTQVAN